MSYPAGTVEVRGTQYPVSVTDNGGWTAEFNGRRYSADSKEGLRTLLLRLTKEAAAKVSVRFSWLDYRPGREPRVVHGTATGIHGGNRNVLVLWDNGKRDQLDSGMVRMLRPLSQEEQAELIRLNKAEKDARNALNAFTKPLGLELRSAVEEAIKEQIREG